MIWSGKIKAGALQFVLFIGTVVAVLLLMFVLLSYSHSLFQKKTSNYIEVILAANQRLKLELAPKINNTTSSNTTSANNIGIESNLITSNWGIYALKQVKAQKGNFQFNKIALTGFSNAERFALYLKDNKRPLVLAGKTKIKGAAYLPEQGVKMGNIYGNSYYASQLIYGQEKQSDSVLPQFSEGLKQRLDEINQLQATSNARRESISSKTNLSNSFQDETIFVLGDVIDLNETTLTGNIVVQANDRIRVRANSNLKDVILIAPVIQIENWTKGNFQAFATKRIIVGKQVELAYPSALVVQKNQVEKLEQQAYEPDILIDSYATIKGAILYTDKSEANKFKPHIKIDVNAKIYGEVFCSQNVELKGSIYGSLVTSGFTALENGNIYQNHIYNGQVNSEALPPMYAGLAYSNSSSNQVVKWLY